MNTIEPIDIVVNEVTYSITFNKKYIVHFEDRDEHIDETYFFSDPNNIIKLLILHDAFCDGADVLYSYKSTYSKHAHIFFDSENYDYSNEIENFKSSLLLCLDIIKDEHTLLLGINEEQRKAASIITKQAKESLYNPKYKLCRDVMKTNYENSF
jgi:hypothetical protein